MLNVNKCLAVLAALPVIALFSVFGADARDGKERHVGQPSFRTEAYSFDRDIAFTAIWGSRPGPEILKGFKRAVLYNARGEVVRKITMGSDSVYSLDKMLQEHKSRGPLFVRMYRR